MVLKHYFKWAKSYHRGACTSLRGQTALTSTVQKVLIFHCDPWFQLAVLEASFFVSSWFSAQCLMWWRLSSIKHLSFLALFQLSNPYPTPSRLLESVAPWISNATDFAHQEGSFWQGSKCKGQNEKPKVWTQILPLSEGLFEAWKFIYLFIHQHILLSITCIPVITAHIKMNRTIP